MNPRVLELLKNPKHIQSEDLDLLKGEIDSFPYIQNIRALHLYGVHLFDKENYQKELSTTAAYTTDKKILYQLINGKIQQKPNLEIVEKAIKPILGKSEEPKNTFKYVYQANSFPLRREEPKNEVIDSITIPVSEVEKPVETKEEVVDNKETLEEKDKYEEASCLLQNTLQSEPVYINGERNRILFEGEENFLDDTNVETIDLESTLESGTLVTQTQEKPTTEETQSSNEEEIDEKAIDNEVEKVAEFTPETVIDEDKIESETEKEVVDNASELSFHGTESFLPDVKIQSTTVEEIKAETPQFNINKHEEEMRRLIEEVERKMKESKSAVVEKQKEKEEEEEEILSHDISFAETQSFDVKPEEISQVSEAEQEPELIDVVQEKTEEPVVESEPEVKSTWKPMSFEAHTPDSLLNKSVETQPAKIEEPIIQESPVEIQIEESPKTKEKETSNEVEVLSEAKEDNLENEIVQIDEEIKNDVPSQEAPVMNVSFFGSDISSLKINEPIKEEKKEEDEIQKIVEEVKPQSIDSNVPGFINTWQSWLKIDRSEEIKKEKVEIKNKAIETFIENNPKISQLKDEVSFVVKEKTDDISHLMTETLANLYIEQKLYTKAIKAFEVLINKHPEKKEHFESKIQEIKDIRNRN